MSKTFQQMLRPWKQCRIKMLPDVGMVKVYPEYVLKGSECWLGCYAVTEHLFVPGLFPPVCFFMLLPVASETPSTIPTSRLVFVWNIFTPLYVLCHYSPNASFATPSKSQKCFSTWKALNIALWASSSFFSSCCNIKLKLEVKSVCSISRTQWDTPRIHIYTHTTKPWPREITDYIMPVNLIMDIIKYTSQQRLCLQKPVPLQ